MGKNPRNKPNKPSAEGASELQSAEGAPEPEEIVRRTLRKSSLTIVVDSSCCKKEIIKEFKEFKTISFSSRDDFHPSSCKWALITFTK